MTVKFVNSKLLWLALLLPAISMADGRGSREGTQSGGGPGITIVKDGSRVLLDYVQMVPNFKDINKAGEFERLILNQPFLDSVADGFFSTKFDLDPIGQPSNDLKKGSDFFSSGPFRMALAIVKEWGNSNLLDASREIEAPGMFSPVRWLFEERGILDQLIDFNLLKEQFKNSNPKVSAYYLQTGATYTIRVSVPEWNEMGLLSQVGLLLHEGLRHHQILLFPNDTIFRYDDDALKKATAIMVLCRPNAPLSLYRYLLLHNGASAFGSFDEVVQKYCKSRFDNAN